MIKKNNEYYDKARLYRHNYMKRILSDDGERKLLYELLIDYRTSMGNNSKITQEALQDFTRFVANKFSRNFKP